jgi:hypothetical protein
MQINRTTTNASTISSLVPALVGGAILRILWLFASDGLSHIGHEEAGEATRVAVSLATGHGFADAFPGLGPTAHLLPVNPLIAGAILRVSGVEGATPALALTLWALAQVGVAYLLLHRLFRQIGYSAGRLRGAVFILCLVPVFAHEEVTAFRYWEGALGLCLGTINLTLLMQCWHKRPVTTRLLALIAVASSLCFLVSPPVGVGTAACWAAFGICRLSVRQRLRLTAFTLVAYAGWMIPWAVRNAEVLGEPIVIRSNFGLELAIGNHATALANVNPRAVYMNRLEVIHPYKGIAPNLRAKSMGEIRYSRMLGERTKRWIAQNPGAFAKLCLRHYLEFFFPRPWQFSVGDYDVFSFAKSLIVCLVDGLGLIELMLGLIRRRFGYSALATYVVIVSLPYSLVQNIPRYTYLAYPILCFLAANFLGRMSGMAIGYLVGRRRTVAVRASVKQRPSGQTPVDGNDLSGPSPCLIQPATLS